MSSRTRLEFTYAGDIWSVITPWAKEHGYKLKSSTSSGRLFQKGLGFWVAPTMFCVDQTDGKTIIQIWIRMNLFVRLSVLFILPAEMGIESGGFRAVLPRSMARGAVNKLLAQLGQPLIP